MSHFVNWWNGWKAELLEIIPAFLTLPGLHSKRSSPILINSMTELRSNSFLKTLSKKKTSLPIDIILKQNMFLNRTIKIPRNALKQSENTLKFNLQKVSPLPLSEINFVNVQNSKKKQTTEFSQLIIKKSHLNEIKALFENMGFFVRSISIDNLKPPKFLLRKKSPSDRMELRWMLATIVCAIFTISLYSVNNFTQLQEQKTKLSQLTELRSSLSEQITNQMAQKKKETNQRQKIQAALLHLSLEQKRTQLLSNITQSLPNNAWISEFELQGSSVQLAGFIETDISDVLTNLNNQKIIKTANLNGALSRNASDKTRRFRISILLNDLVDE